MVSDSLFLIAARVAELSFGGINSVTNMGAQPDGRFAAGFVATAGPSRQRASRQK
jgi:hypothetical protein